MLLRKMFFVVLIFFGFINTIISQKAEVAGYIKDMNNVFARQKNVSIKIDIVIKEKNRVINNYSQNSIRYNDMLWTSALNTISIVNKNYKISADNTNKILQVQYPVSNRVKNENLLNLPLDSLADRIDKVICDKLIDNNKRKVRIKLNKEKIEVEFVIDLKTSLFDKVNYYWYEDDPNKPSLSMEMNFVKILFNEKVDESIFSEKKFIKLTSEGVEPTAVYKNYKLILIK